MICILLRKNILTQIQPGIKTKAAANNHYIYFDIARLEPISTTTYMISIITNSLYNGLMPEQWGDHSIAPWSGWMLVSQHSPSLIATIPPTSQTTGITAVPRQEQRIIRTKRPQLSNITAPAPSQSFLISPATSTYTTPRSLDYQSVPLAPSQSPPPPISPFSSTISDDLSEGPSSAKPILHLTPRRGLVTPSQSRSRKPDSTPKSTPSGNSITRYLIPLSTTTPTPQARLRVAY